MKFRGKDDGTVEPTTEMKRRRKTYIEISLLVLGILLVATGLFVFWNLNSIHEYIINSALVFTPTSKAYNAWKTNDPPLTMDIYLFNWTNPEEIFEKDVKPKFQEIGPFRFKEIKEKINVTWNDNNTVTYMHKKHYYFDAENSPLQLEENITTINPVSLTAAYQARNWNFFMKKGLSFSLTTLSQLTITKTAGELLFEGYEDGFLTAAGLVKDVADRFGFFYNKNQTEGTDGTFSIAIANDNNFGKMMSWNFANSTEFYEGSCGAIRGSSGEFYPINRKRDSIEIFSAELCRSAVLEYEEDVVLKGVKGYKYSGRNIFDNGTLNPTNKCFCGGECVPSGVLNVSSCRQNSPSFLSFPHFYDADPYYTNAIEGLEPVKDKHELYITLEPKSGILIDIAARMQLNMLLQPLSSFALFEKVPKIFVPMFYFTQRIPLTDELAEDLKLLQSLPRVLTVSSMVCTIVGGLLLLSFLLSFCFCKMKDYKHEYKISQNTHEEIPLR